MKIFLNYALILASLALVALSRMASSVQDICSILALFTSVVVAVRITGKKPDQTDRKGLWHIHIQRGILLLCVVSGVISSFQWLLYFRQLRWGVDINAILQAINWLLLATIIGRIGWGLFHLRTWRFPTWPSRKKKRSKPADS